MRKILCTALFSLGLLGKAQTDFPKTATDISPLLISEKITDIKLRKVDNTQVSLTSLFAQKPTVLVFYRGGWCPYCNLHLAALGQAENELLDLGYQIIAISPDAPKNLKVTEDKEKVNYLLLSDSKGELAKMMGIAFQAPEKYESILAKGSEGSNTKVLPVPSLFIVDTDATIAFEYISPDFKHRISNDLLIAVAKLLKEKDMIKK